MANAEQREAFIAALDAELARVGPAAFSPAPVIKVFIGRGMKQTTLYRWAERWRMSGRPA